MLTIRKVAKRFFRDDLNDIFVSLEENHVIMRSFFQTCSTTWYDSNLDPSAYAISTSTPWRLGKAPWGRRGYAQKSSGVEIVENNTRARLMTNENSYILHTKNGRWIGLAASDCGPIHLSLVDGLPLV